jgi:hypothetical protein
MRGFVQVSGTLFTLAVFSSIAVAQPANAGKTAPAPVIKSLGKVVQNVVKKIPLSDVHEIAKWLTKEEGDKIKRVVERGFKEKSQFVTGTVSFTVSVHETETYYFGAGTIKHEVTMPCTGTVAVDLDRLLSKANFNPATKTIEIYLPPLKMISVENHSSKMESETTYGGACTSLFDSGAARELEIGLLKTDWAAAARDKQDPNSDHLRKSAAFEIRRVLLNLLEQADPTIKIEVQP